ncbi:hypothetical protein [Bradyrhizobium sp. F1.13.3]|uniref:hypothetical protein n=1 Tax=Bradyrhizobium sp. F1.13.3 TaxID=3156351 RepID=UPI00339ABA05
MGPIYVHALVAFGGSLVAGSASFVAAWFTQNRRESARKKLSEKAKRQKIYRRFIEEASGLYVDALVKSSFDAAILVSIYALIGRMRIQSSDAVLNQASAVVKTIVDTYSEPNRSLVEVQHLVDSESFDPLRDFSQACRQELDAI